MSEIKEKWKNGKCNVGDLLSRISTLEQRVKELEIIREKWESLKFKAFNLNESLCQVNEAWKEEISLKHQVKRHLKKLQDAIDKHEQFKRTHNKIVSLEDEKLYATIK